MTGPALGAAREPVQATATLAIDRPLLTMRWELLTYVHWAVPPAQVQALLPPGLTVDTFDGTAYVGLVPFRMGGIRLHLPEVRAGGRARPDTEERAASGWGASTGRRASTGPRASAGVRLPQGTFPETNVRTYVIGPDGGRGVHFDSLDVTRLAPTLVAQGGYRLPYAWSRMALGVRDERRAYLSRRRWPGPRGASSHLQVRVGRRLGPAEVTDLDHFLSARWSLYAVTGGGRVLRAHVDHDPWALHAAEVVHLDDAMVAAAGYGAVARGAPDHVRAAGDVTVRVGPPRRVG